jgi:hypothetical protein
MKSKLQIIQEKRGEYTRKRTARLSRMSASEIHGRRRLKMALLSKGKKQKEWKPTTPSKEQKVSLFTRFANWLKRLFGFAYPQSNPQA